MNRRTIAAIATPESLKGISADALGCVLTELEDSLKVFSGPAAIAVVNRINRVRTEIARRGLVTYRSFTNQFLVGTPASFAPIA